MISSSKLKNTLKKYNVPGPRYTSYPTVPAWTENISELDYKKSLSSLKDNELLSLYFHLPFCENLCHFCGCTQIITKDHSISSDYTQVLIQEMQLVVQSLENSNKRVIQIHFGGGTPNFFKPLEMREIFNTIEENFSIENDAEIAIEMHPRTSKKDFCDELKNLGFNRISLGVQDFNPLVQEKIRRYQSYEMTKDMLEYLRQIGFSHFNFDLIYGLPFQSIEGWRDTLEKVIELNPDRLAVYSYAHVPWVRPGQRGFSDEDLPNADLKLELFDIAYRFLLEAGYNLIGMDHFAKESDDLSKAIKNGSIHRNFMGYSTKAEAHQIGFGMSSISLVNGNYFQNRKKLKSYKENIKSNSLATFKGIIIDKDVLIRRELINNLMCNGLIDFDALGEKYEINSLSYFRNEIDLLNYFINDGMLVKLDNNYKLTQEGYLCMRNIAMVFDKYLDNLQRNSKNPIFSKTI